MFFSSHLSKDIDKYPPEGLELAFWHCLPPGRIVKLANGGDLALLEWESMKCDVINELEHQSDSGRKVDCEEGEAINGPRDE